MALTLYGLIFFLPLLTLTPFFFGYWLYPDLYFTGYLENPWDQNIYYSFINQAWNGHWLFVNQSTNIPHQRDYVHVLFLLMGKLSFYSGLGVPIIYLGFKYLFGVGIGLLFSHLLRLARLSLKWQLFGVFILLWSEGFSFIARVLIWIGGEAALHFFYPLGGGQGISPWLPLDTVNRDMHVWTAISYTPLLSWAFALILLFYLSLWHALQRESLMCFCLAALVALLLGFSHSYDLVPMTLVSGSWCLLYLSGDGSNRSLRVIFGLFLVYGAILVVVMYQYKVLTSNPGFAVWKTQMVTELSIKDTFSWITGFGCLALGYLELCLRIPIFTRLSRLDQCLFLWLLVQTAALYLPLQFNVRFLLGLSLPLTIHFLYFLKRIFARSQSWLSWTIGGGIVAGCLLTPTFKWLTQYKYALTQATKYHGFEPDYDYFYYKDQMSAYQTLTELSTNDVILSSYDESNRILRFTSAYLIDASEHQSDIRSRKAIISLFEGDDQELQSFLTNNRVTVLVVNKVTHHHFIDKFHDQLSQFQELLSNPHYVIYSVRSKNE